MCTAVDSIHTFTHTQTQVHEHRHTHSHMHTYRQVNTSMHPPTHVPLITSELTISSSWSQPLQCCPSALARPPHCLTTYRYSNHIQQHFIHWCTQWDTNSPSYITLQCYTCTHSLKCTDSRGAIAATHCHGLYRQILNHTLHCPTPACSQHCTHFSLPLPPLLSSSGQVSPHDQHPI